MPNEAVLRTIPLGDSEVCIFCFTSGESAVRRGEIMNFIFHHWLVHRPRLEYRSPHPLTSFL